METKEFRVKYRSRKDQFKLFPLGDIHAGTKHCAEGEIKRQINEISVDPFALWIGMGDYMEAITPNDPRWDVEVISDWVENSNIVESQRKWVVNLFRPIADKCVGLLEGNHEASIRLRNYQDVYLDICRDLKVTPLGYSAFVRFLFSRNVTKDVTTFVGVFMHGSGAAQTEGGKIMRLKRFMDSFEADIYGLGHIHDIKTDSIAQLKINEANNIREVLRVGAITGSWFRTYSQGVRASYAERKGYPPTVLGCPHFTIIPDKKILKVVK